MRDCAGTVTSEGWINLTTGAWSAGAPPAGTIACGDSRSIQVSGTFCDVDPDSGDILGLVLIEYSYAADGSIAAVRLVDAVTGDTYVPEGEVTTCPAGVEQPERDMVQLCDRTDDELGTVQVQAFLRDYARDENGAIVGHSDYTLDGEPYTPTGTVGVCSPFEPCASTVTVLRLCDLNPDVEPDETGRRCAVPFLRHLVHDCTGALVETRDTAMDGTTLYTPVEVVDCGSGGVPAMVEVPWEVVDIQPDPDSDEGLGLLFSLSPIDDPDIVGRVRVTTSSVYNPASCPGTPPQYTYRNPTTYRYEPDEVLREHATYVRVDVVDFDTFEPITGLTPRPDRLGGTAYWDGTTVRPTVSDGSGELYYDGPPEAWQFRIGNTGGGNSCSALSFAAVSLRPEGRCADCDGTSSSPVALLDTELLPVCFFDENGDLLQPVLAEYAYDTERSERVATRYVDLTTGEPVEVPDGATVGICPSADRCTDSFTQMLCDETVEVNWSQTSVVPDPTQPAGRGFIFTLSPTDDPDTVGTIRVLIDRANGSCGANYWPNNATFSYELDDVAQTMETLRVNLEDFDVSESITMLTGGAPERLGGNAYSAAGGVIRSNVNNAYGYMFFDAPPATLSYRFNGSCIGLNFNAVSRRTVQFLRKITTDCETGEVVAVTDATLDGQPYTVAGDIGECSVGTGQCCPDSEVLALCDTDADGTVTGFLRHLTYPQGSGVPSVTDTLLDGATEYAPTGDVGACAQPVSPCRDTSNTLLCDTTGTEAVTLLDTAGVQGDDGWTITAYTDAGCTAENQPDGTVPFPAAWGTGHAPDGGLGTRADQYLGTVACTPVPWSWETAPVRWVMSKTFLVAEDSMAVLQTAQFKGDGGARIRVNGLDAGLYGQWNVPSSGASSQIPVMAGVNSIEVEARDYGGPNFVSGRIDLVTTVTNQFMRRTVLDCVTGETVSITDTTLDGQPYEVTGQVGQCTDSGGGACCEAQPPVPRVDVETDLLCLLDAGGGVLGQVVVERIYDDQTGIRIEQRLTDPTTGEEVELPDGATLGACPAPGMVVCGLDPDDPDAGIAGTITTGMDVDPKAIFVVQPDPIAQQVSFGLAASLGGASTVIPSWTQTTNCGSSGQANAWQAVRLPAVPRPACDDGTVTVTVAFSLRNDGPASTIGGWVAARLVGVSGGVETVYTLEQGGNAPAVGVTKPILLSASLPAAVLAAGELYWDIRIETRQNGCKAWTVSDTVADYTFGIEGCENPPQYAQLVKFCEPLTVTPLPSAPEQDLVVLCDTDPDGVVVQFVRDYLRNTSGGVSGYYDYALDGAEYTTVGVVGVCGDSSEPCRDSSSTVLCDTTGQEALTVFDPTNRPGSDGWQVVSYTGVDPAYPAEAALPYDAPHPAGSPLMGARSDLSAGVGPAWTGYETSPHRWVLRKIFEAPEDGIAVVSSAGFRGDGGARVRVNGIDAGMYGQWNQPATSGTAQIPVTAGPNVVEIEVHDGAGPNFVQGRLDIVMTATAQFMRRTVVDCVTGETVAVVDTTLEGEPYEVTGLVGQCEPVAECCEQAPPEERVDVETELLCIRDEDSGDVLGQVVVERVYDDQSGDRLEQRLTDPTTGDPVELPAGAVLARCPSPDRITRQICVVESGATEFLTNAANATSGQDTDWQWSPVLDGSWYPMYRVAANPAWTVQDTAPSQAHWVSPHASKSVCSPNVATAPNVTGTWYTRASWNLPANVSPDSIRIAASVLNADNDVVQWRLNDGAWQPVAGGGLTPPAWTITPSAVPGGRAGQNEIVVQITETQPAVTCPSPNQAGMILHVAATYDYEPRVWTQVIEDGRVYYLDETGTRRDTIPDGQRVVSCGGSGGECCPTEECRNTTTVLLCDLADSPALEPAAVTVRAAAPPAAAMTAQYPNHRWQDADPMAVQTVVDGEAGAWGNTDGLDNSSRPDWFVWGGFGFALAEAPQCGTWDDAGDVVMTMRVKVINDGPRQGIDADGVFVLFNGTTWIGAKSVQNSLPVGASSTLTLDPFTVAVADLPNVVAVLALELKQGTNEKTWTVREFTYSLTPVPGSGTAVPECETQFLRTLVTDCVTGEVVSTSDTTLDGEPYEVQGDVAQCTTAGGSTPPADEPRTDTEVLHLCDVQEDGTVAGEFLRRLTFDGVGQPLQTADTLLDGATPYLVTGTAAQCPAAAVGSDVELLPMCVIDNATGGTIQRILAEVRYDEETGERAGVSYVDPQTWGPVALPGGTHIGLCPEAQGPEPTPDCRTASTVELCDLAVTESVTVLDPTSVLGPDGWQVASFTGAQPGYGPEQPVPYDAYHRINGAGVGQLSSRSDFTMGPTNGPWPGYDNAPMVWVLSKTFTLTVGGTAKVVVDGFKGDHGARVRVNGDDLGLYAQCNTPVDSGVFEVPVSAGANTIVIEDHDVSNVSYVQGRITVTVSGQTRFLRHYVLDCANGEVLSFTDTTVDGAPYTVAGEIGQCTVPVDDQDGGASGTPCMAQHVIEQCRYDDTDGDGVGDVTYRELIGVSCDGAVTSLGTYTEDLAEPYTPVAPVADGPVEGAPPAHGVQAHRIMLAAGSSWDAGTVPLLQAVTVVAHGTGQVTTADGTTGLAAGESIGWSVARDSDAALTGPLVVTAADGPVAVAWTQSVAL
ncbi:hypothetical protein ACGFR8_08025 [Streptomyces brevispora]|uniref:hypothetical protein n=1 Tax=Streptomyces brevispora TaxID=887462 RepID=UPI00371C0E26